MHTQLMKRLRQGAVLLIVMAGLSACASTPQAPASELQAAELAIASAEQEQIENNALPELSDASAARKQATIARNDAAMARDQAKSAQHDANTARLETEQLARLVSELNARDTDRGLVVTLDDVLFATGRSTIVGANNSNLSRLAVFLNQYAERTVTIEGHTDSVGAESSNMSLSQSRADAVRNYLVREGVASNRLSAMGKGEGSPIFSNITNTGRQQNRRVEVIIANVVPIITVN